MCPPPTLRTLLTASTLVTGPTRRTAPGPGRCRGSRLDDLAIQPGGVLGERPVTLAGIGQTIEVTAQGVRLPPVPPAPAAPPQAATSTAPFGPTASSASEVTAIAIPYFQWDNRDGGPMRVWMPQG